MHDADTDSNDDASTNDDDVDNDGNSPDANEPGNNNESDDADDDAPIAGVYNTPPTDKDDWIGDAIMYDWCKGTMWCSNSRYSWGIYADWHGQKDTHVTQGSHG